MSKMGHEEEEEEKEEDDDEDDLEQPPLQDKHNETTTDDDDDVTSSASATTTTSKTASTSSSTSSPSGNTATIAQVFSFGAGPKKVFGLFFGIVAAMVAGAVGPFMIFFFAHAFSDLVAEPTSDDYLEAVKELAYVFLVLGAVALVSLSAYSTCLETMAGEMTRDLKTKWFQALLRQDVAYFDLQKDVSGTAMTISINGAKYQRGIGNKLGLGIQFIVTFLGGFGYAFYSSWRTSLLVLAVIPFMAASGIFLVKMNTSQTQRANAAYAQAGSTVYTTVSSIRTILSLNAAETMIAKFVNGTEQAYKDAVSQVHWLGLANGSIMASFLVLFCIVPIFGAYLLYDQVRENGCDPSGAVPDAEICNPSAVDVFGALFGMVFGASVLPQISTVTESFTEARSACYLAIEAMSRRVGSDDDEEEDENDDDDDIDNSKNKKDDNGDEEEEEEEEKDTKEQGPLHHQSSQTTNNNNGKHKKKKKKIKLPKYSIDSSSPDGKQPNEICGQVDFSNVTFVYPSRQEVHVLKEFNLQIDAGKTIAIVGPSGSGKSTIAQLVERFYDPIDGSIQLDGNDLRELNVKWLRQQIGMVGQEPTLFACSIRDNIAHGLPGATLKQIKAAARTANAHDFIMSFPDGYDTQVGDKGAKLSGGQKQRIAISRALIMNPKVLLLDEATSALDSESERIVQRSIDQLLENGKYTTIVVAHRLSTIRNADKIVVLDGGKVVETGTHEELIEMGGQYCSLVRAQTNPQKEATQEEPPKPSAPIEDPKPTAERGSSHSANLDGSGVEDESGDAETEDAILRFQGVHFAYPTRADTTVFRGLNLSVYPGETLAIVGPSGHGKSTIIQLAERFYDPTKGKIEFDGVNLQSLNVQWLRQQIGLVSQEPILFDTTIRENIKFGLENVTDEEMELAAKEANAHDFITGFPDGYDTPVGEAGTQVSGGQKQRICIARVLLRHPRVLLLDEATSALDSESEKIVQEALDKIMASHSRTTIVIAHRLSTVRNASRIAVVLDGKVREIGTYDELMVKPKGHFRRLQAYQNLEGPTSGEPEPVAGKKKGKAHKKKKAQQLQDKKQKEKEQKQKEEEEIEAIDADKERQFGARARQLAQKDLKFFMIGGVGAVLAGLMFPAWGFIFAFTIELLYTPVSPCPDGADCQAVWDDTADDMKALAAKLGVSSVAVVVTTLVGYMWLFYGFGTATERLNKRVRDACFNSLVRQEVAFFDVQPVGTLTAELQDDAALIHAFSGQPIRALIISLASVAVGLVIGFYYMWPFALLFLSVLPFLGFGAEMEMRMYIKAEDEGDDSIEEEHSPGGIVVESLLNIRTIASLTMEESKLAEFSDALKAADPKPIQTNFLKGSGFGLGQFFQMWGMGLMFWFGAWLLHEYPNQWEFRDYMISMFALFFCLYGLTVAFEGATDRKRAKLAASRIFELTDRTSQIDPLFEGGWKGAPGNKPRKSLNRKRSSKKRMSSNSPKRKSNRKVTDHVHDKNENVAKSSPPVSPSGGLKKKHSERKSASPHHKSKRKVTTDDLKAEIPEPPVESSSSPDHHHHHHHSKKLEEARQHSDKQQQHTERKSSHSPKHKSKRKVTTDGGNVREEIRSSPGVTDSPRRHRPSHKVEKQQSERKSPRSPKHKSKRTMSAPNLGVKNKDVAKATPPPAPPLVEPSSPSRLREHNTEQEHHRHHGGKTNADSEGKHHHRRHHHQQQQRSSSKKLNVKADVTEEEEPPANV